MKRLQKHIDEIAVCKSVFARQIGISPSYLSDLLSGRRTPALELAFHIECKTNGRVPAFSWIKDKESVTRERAE